jgi:aspartate kinase
MIVFKFGGASVKDAEGIRNVARIIARYQAENPVVIVSASGKTTNALEAVVNAHCLGLGDAAAALEGVKKHHRAILEDLFGPDHPIYADVHDAFAEIEWMLEETPGHDPYDYVYDQMVSVGEFLSTKIVAAHLDQLGMAARWLDVRDVLRTDATYREANVDWAETEKRMLAIVPELRRQGLVVTQGFVGVTPENTTTTLGREGSDYTAAIFAHCLRAEGMTIWKDVPGVLNADPRLFSDARKIDHLSYEEAIEMTYYGAQVIHPKTMRPLQVRNIPLFVKSFLDPDGLGTVVDGRPVEQPYPPVIVVKKQQALLQVASNDFHFINEDKLHELFGLFAKHRVKVNLLQNTAMKCLMCVDSQPMKLEGLLRDLQGTYDVAVTDQLELITVRHYDEPLVDWLKQGRRVHLEERIPQTVQLVVQA